jgi:glycosyltransferase involved in cell wall biosynthesis
MILNGPLNGTSYGIVFSNILKELQKMGEIYVFPIGNIARDTMPFTIGRLAPNLDLPCLKVWHQFGMNESVSSGFKAGYTFFEMDELTKWELNSLNCLDHLICPTAWQAEVCHNSGYSGDISVIPPGFDPEIFKPIQYFPKKCVFLSIGKWEVRKQQDVIVAAFSKAFPKNEEVSLWMSCENRFLGEEFNKKKKRQYEQLLQDRVRVISRLSSHEEIARLIQQSYCFVAPSLAEGFNMPLLESMACNKEVIATDYSGHTEFITDKCCKIQITGKERADDKMWFNRNEFQNCGSWATYDFDDLVDAMRFTYEKWRGGVVSGTADDVKQFTWSSTAKDIHSCLMNKR